MEEGGQREFVSLLLRTLRPDGPCVPPRTWEHIPSESGAAAAAAAAADASTSAASPESVEPACDPLVVSEAVLVRLVLNALQGVKSALDDIEKVSAIFYSNSADRTFHQIPNLWQRSSSVNTLGRLLKSVGRSGLLFFLLRKFVDYFLGMEQSLKVQCQNKDTRNRNQTSKVSAENDSVAQVQKIYKDELGASPPYTLVNQAFAVAVGKVLEGYLCALNTVFSSVKHRRSSKIADKVKHASLNVGSLTTALSEITLLEVYIHTKELRTRIEALGNICCLRIDDNTFSEFYEEGLPARINLEFGSFPRGADLLTYLYVQLRDADPTHRSLLKFLFLHSCEPYCCFIRSWIFTAKINDPYKEFILEYSDRSSHLSGTSSTLTKERVYAAVPCFLKHVRPPLLRAGQQLQVLIKLLDICNSSVFGEHSSGEVNACCDLTSLEDVLPRWCDSSNDSVPCLSPLTFSNKDAEAMIKKRESMYKMMYAKLQFFLKRLDVGYQPVEKKVMPFRNVSFYSNERDSLVTDESFGFSPSIDEPSYVVVGFKDTDASSTSDGSSYGTDLKQTSEDFCFTGSELGSEPEESSDICDIAVEQNNVPASAFSACYSIQSINQNSCGTEDSCASVVASLRRPVFAPKKCVRMDPNEAVNSQNESMKLNLFSDPLQHDHLRCDKITRNLYEHPLFAISWPLGGLSKNPLVANRKCESQKQSLPTAIDENMRLFETENPNAVKMYALESFMSEQTTRTANLFNGHEIFTDVVGQTWNPLKYDLSARPVLTNAAWLHNIRYNRRAFLPYFDFSLVEDPYGVFSERVASQSGDRLRDQLHVPVNSTSIGVNEHIRNDVSISQAEESGFDSAFPSARQSHTNKFLGDFPEKVSGGAKWEGLLRYSGDDVQTISGAVDNGLVATCDLPIDVAVDKCIVQEILHQYVYISNFTIKLLEEGFDLQEHLLALRRYHFMEFADWADSFVVSLWSHKWSASEPINMAAEIQRLLVVALQRSSCESDPYHERLHVYKKGQDVMPLSFSAIGAFDFIGLGYKVDWPISIIVTQDALKVYSEIFSFLLQVRLAVFSLSSVWHSLKALVHSIGSRLYLGGKEMKDFNFFLKIRQQVNHFVSTLQQYLQSQLSDVSWCRFLHSLKHQVNDMLDLESVHMSYLADAKNICFLSVETHTIAKIIKTVLQCALDFRSCFNDNVPKVGLNGPDLSFLFGQINFSKAITIKTTFEKNIKDLYLCYLKSPKHSEFSLHRFWSYLDYNDYYSTEIIQGISY